MVRDIIFFIWSIGLLLIANTLKDNPQILLILVMALPIGFFSLAIPEIFFKKSKLAKILTKRII